MRFSVFNKFDIQYLSQVQPSDWPDVTPKFIDYVAYAHCFPYKLTFADSMVSVGCVIVHGNVAWLAHIIVAADHRNKGLGKRMTQFLVDDARAKLCTTIELIATELGGFVYQKLGFRTVTEYVFYKNIECDITEHRSSSISSYEQKYYDAIARLDYIASGDNRIRSLDPFLATGQVLIKAGSLVGFYLPDCGDGLIVANTPESGVLLMLHRLRTHKNACFPIDNLSAQKQMAVLNMGISDRARRMRLGKDIPSRLELIYNRIGGNLG